MFNSKSRVAYKAITVVLSLFTAVVAYGQIDRSDNQAFLYQGARLIVGDGTVIENGALYIQGRDIVAVGVVGEVDTPEGIEIIDVSGKTIMPALIDGHAHLGYEGYGSWGAQNYSKENLIEHLQRYAYYGFAAVFSAGSDAEDLARQLQQEQLTGSLASARLLFAAGMAPPGQGPNPQFLAHTLTVAQSFEQTVLRGLVNPDQARQQVQEVAAKQIPFIKIWVDDRAGSQDKLSPEIYRAVIDEATQAGIEVFVHQQSAADMADLIEAGAAGFLHGRLGTALDTQLAGKLARARTFVVPNLGLARLRVERLADDEFLTDTLPAEVATRLARDFDQLGGVVDQASLTSEQDQPLREAFARLVEADVDIVLGTDSGAIPNHFFGYSGHRELEIFVQLGLTPMQALMAGTSVAASQLGLDDLGSLAEGKAADFLVLDSNPLLDIRNTRAIANVVLNGQQLDRQALLTTWITATADR